MPQPFGAEKVEPKRATKKVATKEPKTKANKPEGKLIETVISKACF